MTIFRSQNTQCSHWQTTAWGPYTGYLQLYFIHIPHYLPQCLITSRPEKIDIKLSVSNHHHANKRCKNYKFVCILCSLSLGNLTNICFYLTYLQVGLGE